MSAHAGRNIILLPHVKLKFLHFVARKHKIPKMSRKIFLKLYSVVELSENVHEECRYCSHMLKGDNQINFLYFYNM